VIAYRAPTVADAAAIGALGRETFVEAFGHLYSAENLDQFMERVYASESVAADIADPGIDLRLAEDDGRMIGYCKIGYYQSLDYDGGDQRIVELRQLYVFKSHHGTGVAQVLTDWAIAQAQKNGADAMLLSVYSDNPRGQRFYQKNGFTHVADTYFMVGDHRDDEYLYLRPLG
jgi:ribosomal protein S18 acetylase RimI-like enzyme